MENVLNSVLTALKNALQTLHLTTANRIVLVLSPFLAAAAGWTCATFAQLVPGVNLGAGELTAVYIAGATLISAKILLWLNGSQKQAAADRLNAQGVQGIPPTK